MGRKQWLYTVLGCRVTLWKSDAHHNIPALAAENTLLKSVDDIIGLPDN